MLQTVRLMISLLLGALFCVYSYQYWDLPLTLYFHQLQMTAPHYEIAIFDAITFMGSGTAILLLAALLVVYAWFIKKDKALSHLHFLVAMNVIVASLICNVLKTLLGRARPEMYFANAQYGFYFHSTQASFWSFPSGHTTATMAFVFSLGMLFPRTRVWGFIYLAAIMFSRLFLTWHYLSDVVAGMMLGGMVSYVMTQYVLSRRWIVKPQYQKA